MKLPNHNGYCKLDSAAIALSIETTVIYTRYNNIFIEKSHYKLTKKELHWKNVRLNEMKWMKNELADQLHFIGCDQLLSRTPDTLWIRCCQHSLFLVSFLFGSFMVTLFIENVVVFILLDTFCFYVHSSFILQLAIEMK